MKNSSVLYPTTFSTTIAVNIRIEICGGDRPTDPDEIGESYALKIIFAPSDPMVTGSGIPVDEVVALKIIIHRDQWALL